jgi:Beta-lactamase
VPETTQRSNSVGRGASVYRHISKGGESHRGKRNCWQGPARGVVILAVMAPIGPGGPRPSARTKAFRLDLQSKLDALVTGPEPVAPGASACVVGPQGTWGGSAGVGIVKTGETMSPDARMRIQSNSKTWLTAVIFQLVNEGTMPPPGSIPEAARATPLSAKVPVRPAAPMCTTTRRAPRWRYCSSMGSEAAPQSPGRRGPSRPPSSSIAVPSRASSSMSWKFRVTPGERGNGRCDLSFGAG